MAMTIVFSYRFTQILNSATYSLNFPRSMFITADTIKLGHSICALFATGIWKVFRMLVRCLFCNIVLLKYFIILIFYWLFKWNVNTFIP
jgi:hypothetical protein